MRGMRQAVLLVILGCFLVASCSTGTPGKNSPGLSAGEKRARAEAGFAMAVSSYTNTLLADVYRAVDGATTSTAPGFRSSAQQATTVTISLDTTPGLNVISRGTILFEKTDGSAAATQFEVNLEVHSEWENGYFPYGTENLASEGAVDTTGDIIIVVEGKSLVVNGKITLVGMFVVGADSHPVDVEVTLTRTGGAYRGTLGGAAVNGLFGVIRKIPVVPGEEGDEDEEEVVTPPLIVGCTFASGPRYGQCWDYVGSAAKTTFHDSCYANEGTEAVAACTLVNRLGTCTTDAGSANERKIRYSVLQWGESTASVNCANTEWGESGTWASGE